MSKKWGVVLFEAGSDKKKRLTEKGGVGLQKER